MRNFTAKMLCLSVCLAHWIGASAPAGTPLWTNRFDGPGRNNDQAFAIAAGSSGNVYVTGSSYNSAGVTDYVTIKYLTAIPPGPGLNFAKVGNRLVLSWAGAGFKLQSAPSVNGPYADIPGAVSPYTVPFAAQKQFFRLRKI